MDIQHRRYPDHCHRFLHYYYAALLEQAVSAQDCRPALAVYTIVVLTSGDKHASDMSVIDFDPKDRHGQGLGEIPHKIVYLCPKYLNDETPEASREWLLAINDSLDEQVDETHYHKACVQKVFASIQKNTLTPEDRARMKDEYSEDLLRREEWEKGIAKGREEGREEGAKIKALDIARNLLDVLDDATIAQKTGLTVVEILKLRQEKRDDIVTLTTFLCFKSWTALLDFMLVGLERRHQADEIELWVAK